MNENSNFDSKVVSYHSETIDESDELYVWVLSFKTSLQLTLRSIGVGLLLTQVYLNTDLFIHL